MNHILVGVDGTAAGDAALRWALDEGAARGIGVTACHAWQIDYGYSYGFAAVPLIDLDSEPQAERVLAEALARATVGARVAVGVGGPAAPPATSLVLRGPAAQVLEEQARTASMLVLGRRHETAASRLLGGSVISAALHHVACPVVVVPKSYEAADGAARVVVGVADGEASEGALIWAAKAAAVHARTLVPVLVRPPSTAAQTGPNWPDAASLDAFALSELARHASGTVPGVLAAVEPEVLVGVAGEELVRFARPDDVLVVGSRGRGHLAGWLLGSSSSYVTHHAECPVVVVREPAEPA